MNNIDKEDEINNEKPLDHIENLLNSSEFNIKMDEFKYIFDKAFSLIKELGKWSESTAQLFFMEILRNFNVAYKILFCQILFIPLLVIFILSICIFLGIIGYSFYDNLIIASGIFLTSLFMVLAFLLYWQKKLSQFLGFEQTILQVKEGVDVIINTSK
jgi:hypothetical protein